MRRYATFSLLALLGFLSGIAPPPSVFGPLIRRADAAPQRPRGVANSIVIRNAGRAGIRDYPFQFGRPFVQGAIAHAPQALLNGVAVPTQADVKNRYPDGSVEFAVIAVVIPSIPANGSAALTFKDTTANSNTPLTTAQMLGTNYNFDAAISLAFPARIVGPPMASTLAQWQAVTNGGFAITIGGTPYALTGLNFSAVTSIPGILPVLQAGLKAAGAPVALSTALQPIGARAFIIQTSATGAAASLSYATAPASGTDISAMLGWTSATKLVANLAGSTGSASARAMLNAGDCTPWTAGPVAQTMICADDSAAGSFDIGNGDGFTPFRPRFEATFWPATNQVFVRAIGENDKTTQLEDLAYQLSISGGSASPAVEYTADFTGDQATNPKFDWSLTRWSRTFWLGGTPSPEVNIDNNLAYLESTRFIPNYDPSVIVPASAIATEYGEWTNNPHDLYDGTWDGGLWQSGMNAPGARQEIGPYPTWEVLWLYTGDWRMRQMALGMSDLAGAFPANLREGDPTKRLSRADPTGLSPETGLGHVVSVTDRQTLSTYTEGQLAYGYTTPGDAVKIVGPLDTNQPWSFGTAHEPQPFFVPYVLTGDPWYLDSAYMWAGFSAAQSDDVTTQADGRGPSGDYGAINGELRGAAWVGRSRAETAFMAPDGSPEKTYFTYLMNDAIARMEGVLGITGTPYDGAAIKVWGATTGDPWTFSNGGPVAGKAPTLGNWDSNGAPGPNSQTSANSSVWANLQNGIFASGAASTITDPWMNGFLTYALGREAELGFAARPLQEYTGAWATSLIDSSGQPWAINVYEMPVEQAAGGFFPSWAATFAAFTPQYLSPTGVPIDPTTNAPSGTQNGPTAFANDLGVEGYPLYQLGGMAMLDDAGAPGAAQAEAWLKANVITPAMSAIETAPTWDIVPRTDANALPAIPTATPPG